MDEKERVLYFVSFKSDKGHIASARAINTDHRSVDEFGEWIYKMTKDLEKDSGGVTYVPMNIAMIR